MKILNIKYFVLLIIPVTIFSTFSILTSGVKAQGSENSICIPSGCPDTYLPDFACINRKIINPEEKCCENKCPEGGAVEQPEIYDEVLNLFDTSIAINSERKIVSLINLLITSILAGYSAYALVFGVYLAAYKRSGTIDDGEIANIQKTLTRLVLGFVLAWSFIFILQFIFSLLGFGSLNDVILIGDPDAKEIIIT